MVYTKVKQVKSPKTLQQLVDYICNEKKTVKVIETAHDVFELSLIGNQKQEQIVSGHLIVDEVNAYEEMMLTNRLANQHHGRVDKTFMQDGTQGSKTEVYAHHIIQSFSPDDNLTPEQIHEIGRRTAMELTGGGHEFIVATHMDKEHLHNHIIFNATDVNTLKKFRWQNGTKRLLENISDRHAMAFGAKIIQREIFDHKKYLVYQRQTVHKREIKSRLDFLLKHSTSLEDFLGKAQALDLAVDTSGKFVKYRRLDSDQSKNTRDHTLSKKRIYSLEAITQRVALNQVVYSIDEIKDKYQELQETKAEDFELRLKVKPWQVKEESSKGIYLELDYGVRSQGLVHIPYRFVDKLEDGSFELFIKPSHFFYFTNSDHQRSHRMIKGDVLVKQLAHHNGNYILKKNPNISKLDELIREFNFLNQHQVTNSDQLEELAQRFTDQLAEAEQTMSILDDKLTRLNKIRGALEMLQTSDIVDNLTAQEVLEGYRIPLDYPVEHLDKELVEVSVERSHLKETIDRIVFDYKKMETLKDNHRVQDMERRK